MASKKTWIWIIVACLGLGVLALAAVAGLGVYFVASNISTGRASDADALRSFDAVRTEFREERPLFEVDADDKPRLTRKLGDMPTASRRPENLWILAWDPDDARLLKISLPFWMLRLGKNNIDIRNGSGFDLDQLDLNVDELERVGPALLFDLRTPDGERVLVWTR